MKTFRLSLLLLLLAGSFWTCTDHRQSPLAPQRLRLRATDNSIANNGYQGRTEYTYDQMGRQATVFRPGVSRAVFSYDEQGRLLRYDNKSEKSGLIRRTSLEYSASGTSATVRFYAGSDSNPIVETGAISPGSSGSIGFDANGRITSAYAGDGPGRSYGNYTYTGDNITKAVTGLNKSESTSLLSYDSNPNPYYNVITPEFDAGIGVDNDDIIRRSNRNNITTGYIYEYNAQGLPTKARVKGQPGELVFTYESY